MTIFFYDKTFEGLLSSVFDAFSFKLFPEKLIKTGELEPMFVDASHTVVTDAKHSMRVWNALKKKMQQYALNMLTYVWLSEIEGSDELLFRYICKTFATDKKIEYNFGDADILEVEKIARKVSHEALFIKQFVRFQKTADGIYFAPIRPIYNALPLTIDHFANRFADQQWVIYDLKRKYGFYYDLKTTREISFAEEEHLLNGKLDVSLMAEDEKIFQDLWKGYFKSIAIKERINPRKQRQDMPIRFWQNLTEKQ